MFVLRPINTPSLLLKNDTSTMLSAIDDLGVEKAAPSKYTTWPAAPANHHSSEPGTGSMPTELHRRHLSDWLQRDRRQIHEEQFALVVADVEVR